MTKATMVRVDPGQHQRLRQRCGEREFGDPQRRPHTMKGVVGLLIELWLLWQNADLPDPLALLARMIRDWKAWKQDTSKPPTISLHHMVAGWITDAQAMLDGVNHVRHALGLDEWTPES